MALLPPIPYLLWSRCSALGMLPLSAAAVTLLPRMAVCTLLHLCFLNPESTAEFLKVH